MRAEYLKAPAPISVTVLGIVMSVRLDPANAPLMIYRVPSLTIYEPVSPRFA